VVAGVVATAFAASPATAQTMAIDLPPGRLGEQVIALGRLSRASIVVPDAALWSRRVPALRGRMAVAEAVGLAARRAGARAERLGPGSWRLTPRPVARRRPAMPQLAYRPPDPMPAEADIVITASKRDLSRDRFAGQVRRIDGLDLSLGGSGGTEKLAARLASVASTHLGAGRNKLFIRGIADSSFTGPTQATVGQYFGDLRLSYNAPDPDLRLTDLAAVEVLEGPQGTLYGAGSLGGLIRLVPNPVDLAGASGMAAIGGSTTRAGAPGADVEAAINLPILADRLAIRVAGVAASEGGYIDKPLLGRRDVNRTRIAGGRGTLHLALGDGWSMELVGIGQRIRGADSQYADRDGPALTRSAPVTEGFRADFGQAQLVVAGLIGDVRVRSSTGITAHDLSERYDATAPEGPPRLFAQENRTRMRANETRAWRTAPDGAGWLAGFSYLRNRTRLTRLLGAPGDLVPLAGVDNSIAETTAYGEASLRLLPGLLVTAGLRATRSVLDGAGEDVPEPVAPLRLAITARRTQTIVLPSGSALIDLAPRTSLFFRYQQGFRPGGLAIEGDFVRQFRNDRVATIEAGLRTGRAGRDAVDLAITVARTAWRDIQADFIDGSGLPSTANIGDGRIWTAEATVGVMPADGLRVEGAVSYNDGRVDEPSRVLVAALASEDGGDATAARAALFARLQQIPNVARVTARAGAIYQHRLAGGRDLRVDGWVRYVGASRLGVGPVLGQLQGSYLDSGLTARVAFGAVGLTAGVTNLLDTRGNRFALGTPFVTGRDQVTPLRPRSLRIGIDARF
jgi:outer membrane receptor protein involved in Fe transport